jgi:hypothetical protein
LTTIRIASVNGVPPENAGFSLIAQTTQEWEKLINTNDAFQIENGEIKGFNKALSSRQRQQYHELVIPTGVTAIGANAFSNSNILTVSIPGSVTSIGAGAFSHNQISRLSIPSSVSNIGSEAFANNKLNEITFNRSGTTIGDGAFSSEFMREYKKSNGQSGTYYKDSKGYWWLGSYALGHAEKHYEQQKRISSRNGHVGFYMANVDESHISPEYPEAQEALKDSIGVVRGGVFGLSWSPVGYLVLGVEGKYAVGDFYTGEQNKYGGYKKKGYHYLTFAPTVGVVIPMDKDGIVRFHINGKYEIGNFVGLDGSLGANQAIAYDVGVGWHSHITNWGLYVRYEGVFLKEQYLNSFAVGVSF